MTYESIQVAQKPTLPADGLPTAGQHHGRDKRPNVRPWMTRYVASNGGSPHSQNSTA
jgi:hypothetical protein